jgi:mannitol operon repressor
MCYSFDMLLSTAEDLAKFVDELKRESDRGLALVAAALIDDRLLETLRGFFVANAASPRLLDEGNAAIGSLSSRTDACFALGLIDDFEYAEIGLLRKVRNEFAHAKHGMSFKDERVKGLCSGFKSDLPEGGDYPLNDARFRFMNATVALALRLYHRPEWVEQERRTAKTWVSMDMVSWRRVEDQPPPKGVPVIAIGKIKEPRGSAD